MTKTLNRATASNPKTTGSTLAFSDASWGLRVTAACRLSFTLIDLNGESGRKNGMASMAVNDPRFQALLRSAPEMRITNDKHSEEYSELIQGFLAKLQKEWDGIPVEVTIEKGLPTHHGFGSKTRTLLSLGKAYAEINNRKVEPGALASFAGRAGTSGGSVNLIERGGFLVDGGHATPMDFNEDPRRYLVPSRYAGSGAIPPVLIHSRFPPWPILMILPEGRRIHGQQEKDFFHQALPMPAPEAHRTAHLVMLNLATSIIEADYPAFCRALNTLTCSTYFKQKQIAAQGENVQRVLREALDHGVDAIGMSSMGPVCFAFSERPGEAVRWLEEMRHAGVVRASWFSRVENRPIQLERVPAWLDS